MYIKQIFLSLSLVIFITSCSKEPCPEQGRIFSCNTDAFIGTWEFMGYDLDEDSCLSSMEAPTGFGELIIREESESSRNLVVGNVIYRISSAGRECVASCIPGSLIGALFFSSELTLSNSNFLIYTKDSFGSSDRRSVYRRKT